jgi:hypothetical protein
VSGGRALVDHSGGDANLFSGTSSIDLNALETVDISF